MNSSARVILKLLYNYSVHLYIYVIDCYSKVTKSRGIIYLLSGNHTTDIYSKMRCVKFLLRKL